MKPTEEKIQSNTSDLPVYLFKQGNNCEAYRYFGAHLETRVGESGVVFRVWAPHAVAISVVGDFNSWKPGSHPMHKVDGDSVWELFIPGIAIITGTDVSCFSGTFKAAVQYFHGKNEGDRKSVV